jgi:exosortase/archaeosortase family protein
MQLSKEFVTMTLAQQVKKISPFAWIRKSAKSAHGKIVLMGLFVGLCYLPVWLAGLVNRGPQSTDGFTLATCFVGLGFYCLWKARSQLSLLQASEEDRLLGYILIVSGALLFPFCRFAIWPQALLWLMILVGIACSTWGLRFFQQHQPLVVSALVSAYPQPTTTARLLWEAITPYQYLEQIMAQAGSWALRLCGMEANAVETFVTMPEGAVDIYWGCNGFDMALTTMAAGLIMGLLLKQNWHKIAVMIGLGALLSLIFNVPRIMLLAVASVYWGSSWFDFWHGPWGGQIFSGVLFTVYYYVVMGIVQQRDRPSH